MKYDNIAITDLDGVLITSNPWNQDEIHDDGYSDFNPRCVKRYNELLEETGYDIILSSTRRESVDIDQMNKYFEARGIKKKIIGYVPNYNVEGERWLTRKEEIERFLEEHKPKNYIILDDDKSLSDLKEDIKINWIQTYIGIGLK